MRIIVIAITLITLIAVVVVSILYGTDLFIPGLKPTPTPTPTVIPTPTVTDYISLIDNLREAGATVDTGGVTQQSCFSVNARVITVNGSDVQVFEYEDATASDTEAALISPDGFSIKTTFNNNEQIWQICGYGWVDLGCQ